MFYYFAKLITILHIKTIPIAIVEKVQYQSIVILCNTLRINTIGPNPAYNTCNLGFLKFLRVNDIYGCSIYVTLFPKQE